MSAIVCLFEHSWHCLSLALEWKLTFSNPVASAEFSKFAGILSAALSQHHLSGFEITQLESLETQWWRPGMLLSDFTYWSLLVTFSPKSSIFLITSEKKILFHAQLVWTAAKVFWIGKWGESHLYDQRSSRVDGGNFRAVVLNPQCSQMGLGKNHYEQN